MDNYKDFKSELPNWVNEDNFELYKMRHSCEHVLQIAAKKLFPEAMRAMGPPIQDGFYFDLDPIGRVIEEKDLEALMEEMNKVISADQPIIREEIKISQAKKLFAGNPYKVELLEELEKEDKTITIYWIGKPNVTDSDFDLCKGPHLESTGQIKFFKLLSIAGAYWRGNEKNKMLTRIYGTVFSTQKELDNYIWQTEEAKKRDHRKLGKELDLFLFSDLVGGGLPLWTAKGTIFRNELDQYVWSLRSKYGYEKVTIPHITKKELYMTSGHWQKYANDLFKITTREGHEFAMKPMNCPHHTQIYSHLPRSYRDLPQRYCETTMVYRDEQSGELAGLSRVRCITQDDAHVFCRKSQLEQEINHIWDIIDTFYSTFGFKLRARLSLHNPDEFEKYLGTPEMWAQNEAYLKTFAENRKVEYYIGLGEAAFYGPKIDFMTNDSIGREWQVATIQLDTNMPERFDLYCVNEESAKERIVMIHGAIMGSIERFGSVLIEHLAGAFPAWLSPEQVVIIPISEAQSAYAQKTNDTLLGEGFRSKADLRNETMQSKIRDGQNQKIPYMLIVGKREEENGSVSIRSRSDKSNVVMGIEEFIKALKQNVSTRKLELNLQ